MLGFMGVDLEFKFVGIGLDFGFMGLVWYKELLG